MTHATGAHRRVAAAWTTSGEPGAVMPERHARASDAPDEEAGGDPIGRAANRGRWSLPTALAFLVWFVFAPQCLSTVAVTRRETNGWKWPLFMLGYLFALAYLAAGATYWIATAAGL